ncbi:MAG: hypothetical protein H0U08_02865 [Actinobacteria bacterium]|nr:hypothetical protein [Actinomycetota bacterium]
MSKRLTLAALTPGPDGSNELRQDLYPYAASGPVSYMERGQTYFGTERTRGGW